MNFIFYYKKFIKKSRFFNKTKFGKIIDIRRKSIFRYKNMSFEKKFINFFSKNSYNLNFLKHYNVFLKSFFYILINRDNSYNHYYYYNDVVNLLEVQKRFYRFELLIKDTIYDLQHMFEVKFKSLDKNHKIYKEHGVSQLPVILYILKRKRLNHSLKLLHLNSYNYLNIKYSDRLFFLILDMLLNPKTFKVNIRKNNIYSYVSKRLYKKL